MSDICLVHLVRKKNGLEPFRSFIESYKKNPAGIDHNLLILYKGFYRKADIAPYEKLLKEMPHSFLSVADVGFDIRPYFLAVQKNDSKYFCFLNSFSVIQDKDWLLKFYRHMSRPGVGIVGATGSWQGLHSPVNKKRALWKKILRPVVLLYLNRYFASFPNCHVRTNAFMIKRTTMLKVRSGTILNKLQAYAFESGKNSITKQVERMGFKPVIVGKDGKGYDRLEWNLSNTFWRGTQDNLLVSDNQTRKYDTATPEWRRKFEMFAWGELVGESQSISTDK